MPDRVQTPQPPQAPRIETGDNQVAIFYQDPLNFIQRRAGVRGELEDMGDDHDVKAVRGKRQGSYAGQYAAVAIPQTVIIQVQLYFIPDTAG